MYVTRISLFEVNSVLRSFNTECILFYSHTKCSHRDTLNDESISNKFH